MRHFVLVPLPPRHFVYICASGTVALKVAQVSSRVGRFWVLRKVKLCVVPLGAK